MRRLAQRWLLLLCAFASSGCSAAELKPVAMSLTCEPSVGVGGVSAVYVTLTNLGSTAVILGGTSVYPRTDPNALIEPVAVGKNWIYAKEISVGEAATLAGGVDKLVAALDHLPSPTAVLTNPLSSLVPGTPAYDKAEEELGISPMWTVLVLPIAVVVTPMKAIDMKWSRLDEGLFFTRNHDGQGPVIRCGNSRSGYLFFPRASYDAVEVEGASAQSVAGTVRCPWR